MSRAVSSRSPQSLARAIEHTRLGIDTCSQDIVRLCDEAQTFGFHAVCIQPCFVRLAVQRLANHGEVPIQQPTWERAPAVVCTVIGFPHGASLVKAQEAERAVADGATELDMVMAVGALLDRQWNRVRQDIADVVAAAQRHVVKVILETAVLTPSHIDAACQLTTEAGAHFVKTSTGFGPGGASVAAVQRMRSQVGSRLGVKASGGIRDLDTALAMLDAGARRLGTSSSVAIVRAAQRRFAA